MSQATASLTYADFRDTEIPRLLALLKTDTTSSQKMARVILYLSDLTAGQRSGFSLALLHKQDMELHTAENYAAMHELSQLIGDITR